MSAFSSGRHPITFDPRALTPLQILCIQASLNEGDKFLDRRQVLDLVLVLNLNPKGILDVEDDHRKIEPINLKFAECRAARDSCRCVTHVMMENFDNFRGEV